MPAGKVRLSVQARRKKHFNDYSAYLGKSRGRGQNYNTHTIDLIIKLFSKRLWPPWSEQIQNCMGMILGVDLNLKKCDAADDGNGIVAELSAAAHHMVTR